MSAPTLDILCLEPWLGGSHADFLESLRARSRHRVDVVGLAPRHWSWRMRSSAWELARRLERDGRARPDVLWVSDYVDLPALLGFLPPAWADVPTVAYFHENQLTYPTTVDPARDGHLAWTNLATLVRADRVVFNSAFHRDELRGAAERWLARLPRPSPRAEVAAALDASHVAYPGVEFDAMPPGAGGDGPLRVLFPHRWEHDKDPLAFLRAVGEAQARGARMELVLLGERAKDLPPDLEARLATVRSIVVHEGFAASRADYARLVGGCDVVVSTARHEFYGVAVVEALVAGCAPLLPNRLAYPEVLGAASRAKGSDGRGGPLAHAGLFECEDGDDGVDALAARLTALAADPAPLRDPAVRAARREALREHDRAALVPRSDELFEDLVSVAHDSRRVP